MKQDGNERGFIAIGEIPSEEDGQFIRRTLHELDIPFEGVYRGSKIDELRRFFGDWYEGLQLIVRPQDAERALAAVGSRLVPAEVWNDGTLYLEQRSTEQLVKLLDFRAIWQEPIPSAAASVLAARGVVYPPDGTCSRARWTTYLTILVIFGPLGLFMTPRGDEMRRTKEGGTRPRYDAITCLKLERYRTNGVLAWVGLYVAAIIILKMMIPMPVKPERQKSPSHSISTPGR